MRFRRAVAVSFASVLLLPLPALIAPLVSGDPVPWAYRIYHPFMYRYPVAFGAHTTLDLQPRSSVGKSLEVARLMVEYW
jgi:hypothetical protein